MWMLVIDQITTNFKALLHSKDTTIHFLDNECNGCHLYNNRHINDLQKNFKQITSERSLSLLFYS